MLNCPFSIAEDERIVVYGVVYQDFLRYFRSFQCRLGIVAVYVTPVTMRVHVDTFSVCISTVTVAGTTTTRVKQQFQPLPSVFSRQILLLDVLAQRQLHYTLKIVQTMENLLEFDRQN